MWLLRWHAQLFSNNNPPIRQIDRKGMRLEEIDNRLPQYPTRLLYTQATARDSSLTVGYIKTESHSTVFRLPPVFALWLLHGRQLKIRHHLVKSASSFVGHSCFFEDISDSFAKPLLWIAFTREIPDTVWTDEEAIPARCFLGRSS